MSSEGEARDPLAQIRQPSWVDRVRRISFLELFEKYRKRMVHDKTLLPFDPTESGEIPYTMERLAFSTGWGLRLSLKIFLPVCLAGFLFSWFVWDYESVIRSCAVAGMIGFGTNWVAVKMLFWPREIRPVFGQGLIPSQRDQLIQKVADEVLENLINAELIEQKIVESKIVTRFSDALITKLRGVVREPEFKQDLRDMILTYVGDVTSNEQFRRSLTAKAEARLEEFAGSSFKSWLVKKLKDVWRAPLIELINREIEGLEGSIDGGLGELDGVLERLPRGLEKHQDGIDHVLTTMLMGLVREVDVREIVLDQLAMVTTEQLETGFREFSDDKLSFITILGGLLGIVGGTVLVWPRAAMLVLTGLGLSMALIDVAVYPLMRSRYWPKQRGGGQAPAVGEGEGVAAHVTSASDSERRS